MIDSVSRSILANRLQPLNGIDLYSKLVYDDECCGGTCYESFCDIAKQVSATDFRYGRTKLVLIYDDLDWVVKIPIFSYIDDDNPGELIKYSHAMTYGDNSYSRSSDYCRTEEKVYGAAKKAGVDMFFAETSRLTNVNVNYPIYVSRKVKSDYLAEDECKLDDDLTSVFRYAEATGFKIKCAFTERYVYKEFLSASLRDYSELKVCDLLDFMQENGITDIHSDNVGRDDDGKIIILDYPGFFD